MRPHGKACATACSAPRPRADAPTSSYKPCPHPRYTLAHFNPLQSEKYMAANWMRRTFVAAACASAALLAACGSSSTESAISPQRFIAFGDGLADVGQKGSSYTINDGSINNWMLRISSNYGGTLKPVSAGGLSYAQGNDRATRTEE